MNLQFIGWLEFKDGWGGWPHSDSCGLWWEWQKRAFLWLHNCIYPFYTPVFWKFWLPSKITSRLPTLIIPIFSWKKKYVFEESSISASILRIHLHGNQHCETWCRSPSRVCNSSSTHCCCAIRTPSLIRIAILLTVLGVFVSMRRFGCKICYDQIACVQHCPVDLRLLLLYDMTFVKPCCIPPKGLVDDFHCINPELLTTDTYQY